MQIEAGNEGVELTANSALGPGGTRTVFTNCGKFFFIYNVTPRLAHVLFTPELLSLVFSFSHLASLAKSARVCKWWSDTALNQLWRELHSVFPLLELVLDINLMRGNPDSALFKVCQMM